MTLVGDVIEEVAKRFAVALGLGEGQVFVDRRSGEAPGPAGYVNMADQGLTLVQGQGTACADAYLLSLDLQADLTDDRTLPVFRQRLAKTGAVFAALTWGPGQGTPIPGVTIPSVASMAVTEPFEPMDATYGLAVRWQGQVWIAAGLP